MPSVDIEFEVCIYIAAHLTVSAYLLEICESLCIFIRCHT